LIVEDAFANGNVLSIYPCWVGDAINVVFPAKFDKTH